MRGRTNSALFPRRINARRTWRCLLACAFTATGLTGAALAQEDPASALEALLGTEIEGVSRHAEKPLDAPANVHVIRRAESQALGHITVGDMLARLPGIYITTSRTYSSVGVRGLNRPGDYNARLLMAIDGYRVNDALYDQALPEYEFPIVADWVKRLELVQGPASSVYGSNALLGVVNAVTLDGADAPGLGLRARYGPRGSILLTGQYGWHEGSADLFVGVARHDLAGETLALPGGSVGGLDGTRYQSIFAKLRIGEWRTTVAAQSREKSAATAPYGTLAGVSGTRFVDGYVYAESFYDSAWQGDWRPSLRLNLSRSTFRGRYVYARAQELRPVAGEGTINRDDATANWAGVDARLHWRGLLNHSIVAGVEARRTTRAAQSNYDEPPLARTYLDRVDRQSTVALYAQDQIRLSERWLATVGARMDHVSGFGAELSPRLALVFRPGSNEAIKAMLGRAFRAPNLYERFYDDGGTSQVPNPRLGPERIATAELVWERLLNRDTRLSVSAYHYRLRDLIDFVPHDETVSRYENVSRGHTSGLDLDLEQHLASRWQWRTSVSLLRTRLNSAPTSNAPRWLAKGHLFGPLDARWSAGVQWQAIGRRMGEGGDVGAYATADLVVRRALGAQGSVALQLQNLADRATYDPATPDTALARIPRERRRLWLDARLAF